MVFSTRYCKKSSCSGTLCGSMRIGALSLCALLTWLLLGFALSGSAYAEDITVRDVQLVPADEGSYALSADFDLELNERLESALSKGVPLYFVVEFECTRPRWYWLDARVVSKKMETRLSFHALTRTYRLSAGALYLSFNSITEALHALGAVRNWNVLAPGELEPASTYQVGVRMWLDVNQLPKPFQVSALTNRDWNISSPWQRWGFTTGASGKIVQ